MPLHRNLGVFTSRGMPLNRLIMQWQGTREGYSKGRERSFHFGNKDHHICGMISHLGPQLAIADGVALAHKLRKEQKVSLAFTGDGGASEGDFHEALNVAAVWDLPVIFVVENNQWGLSTPSIEQFRCGQFIDKGIGYGIEARQVDGNNLLEVYHTVSEIREEMKKTPRPFLLECVTFRMRGHEEASGTKYYPEGLQEKWSASDPVHNFERFVLAKNLLSEKAAEELKNQIKQEISTALDEALAAEKAEVDMEKELRDVFSPFRSHQTAPSGPEKEMRFIDAVSDGLVHAMEKHENLVLMGQDIAE